MFFSLKFLIFLNSVSSAAALVFYLPCVCTHTLTRRENRERPEFGIFKNLRKKNTIFNEHPVVDVKRRGLCLDTASAACICIQFISIGFLWLRNGQTEGGSEKKTGQQKLGDLKILRVGCHQRPL